MPKTTTLTAPTRTYEIDKAHSEASFQVRHLLTKVRGRFSQFDGTITVDEAHPDRSAVTVSIDASSIDTNEPTRDTHLRSADFFAVDEFPTITFTSSHVAQTSPEQLEVTGDLTIRGLTKRVVVPVSLLGTAKDPWGKERAGFEAEFTINRKEFGLTWNAALETGGFLVGDEVRILLSIQAVGE